MHVSKTIVSSVVLAHYGAATDAPVVANNPIDVVYTATLPEQPFFNAPGLEGNVKGFISASAPPDGVGVRFTLRLSNLPKQGGPFPYHIHVNKLTGSNCTSAGAHLDPQNRGEKPPCSGNKASCQVGDLAGKYGMITSDPFLAEYTDEFASLKEGDAAFFGDRSFVVHLANSTRITCADFVKGGSVASPAQCPTLPGGSNTAVSPPAQATCVSPSCSSGPSNGSTITSAAPASAPSIGFWDPTVVTPKGSGTNITGPMSSPTKAIVGAAGRPLPSVLPWLIIGAIWCLA